MMILNKMFMFYCQLNENTGSKVKFVVNMNSQPKRLFIESSSKSATILLTPSLPRGHRFLKCSLFDPGVTQYSRVRPTHGFKNRALACDRKLVDSQLSLWSLNHAKKIHKSLYNRRTQTVRRKEMK